MQKLFETNKNQTADALPKVVNADIVFTSAPYIFYEQFKLDDNFITNLEGVMSSEDVLRTGIKPTPYQKSFKLNSGTESRTVNFQAANKQFSFLSISLVYDKGDQHRSIYDSYNAELASPKIKSIKLENTSNTFSSFSSIKLDTSDIHDKYLLYTQFVAWYCKGLSIAPLLDYAHYLVYQEMSTLEQYFTTSDEKFFIDLRCGKCYTNKIKKLNRDDSVTC